MNMRINVPFSELTTMRLGGPAHFLAEATSVQELVDLYRNAKRLNQPVMTMGGGSNLIVSDKGYDGLVIRNLIPGYTTISEDGDSTTIKIGAGELWDSVVERSVNMGLSGIEALSAIPGTTGAAPVQNIGAYGQEIADTLVSVDAYDSSTDTLVTLSWEDCAFSYRDSIFRGSEQGRYAITAVTLRLFKKAPSKPFYAALESYFASHNVTEYTAASVRAAVIDIRTNKLPDPAVQPNSGSFFKNTIVEKWQANDLLKKYPVMPSYPMDEGHVKIPTGWLIENADLKGELINGIRVHTGNALVLINESATSYADLAAAREEIIATVRDKFQLTISQEPLEI
jgi:UDP-N-acetylmuramate dehydrogenase